MNTKQKAYLGLVATSTIWGTTWVAMKLGVSGLPALELAAIRQTIGGCLFVGFFLLRKEKLPTKSQLKSLLVLSLFTFVFANGFSTWSLQYLPSGLAALIGALYPLCVALIEYFFYKNKNINFLAFIGILLGFSGVVFVFYENAFAIEPKNFTLGLCLAITAMLSWSYSTIMISRSTLKMNSYYSMGWQMLISAVIIYAISVARGENIPLQNIPAKSWLAIAYLVGMGSIIAIVAFIYTMKHLPTSIAALYAYINPIIAIFVGTFLLDEHLTINIIIGSIITLIGVYLVNKSIKKHKIDTPIVDAEAM